MQLQKKLASGEFVVLAEMEPPKGTDVSAMLAHAINVKGKVDAFVIPEMSNAVMKMSALGGALLFQTRGLETVMQVCCRDRNRLALQGDLLAAYALGIPNVMTVAGDDITFGDHHKAKAVNDIDILELLGAIKTLESGKDMAGVELRGAPQFLLGATVKVEVEGAALEQELAALDQKIALGSRFFVTNPVFDLGALEKFMQEFSGRQAKIIPTVLLLKSVGMARYINRHLTAQTRIPEAYINRIQNAPERVRECVQIAGEQVAALKDGGYSGVNLSPLGWEDKIAAILAGAGL
jgi:5,10-methylenetetrahydrofolate reductase